MTFSPNQLRTPDKFFISSRPGDFGVDGHAIQKRDRTGQSPSLSGADKGQRRGFYILIIAHLKEKPGQEAG